MKLFLVGWDRQKNSGKFEFDDEQFDKIERLSPLNETK